MAKIIVANSNRVITSNPKRREYINLMIPKRLAYSADVVLSKEPFKDTLHVWKNRFGHPLRGSEVSKWGLLHDSNISYLMESEDVRDFFSR